MLFALVILVIARGVLDLRRKSRTKFDVEVLANRFRGFYGSPVPWDDRDSTVSLFKDQLCILDSDGKYRMHSRNPVKQEQPHHGQFHRIRPYSANVRLAFGQ
jgi:hypothetical protein